MGERMEDVLILIKLCERRRDSWKGAQNSLMTVLGPVGVQGVSEPLLPKHLPRTK
jgi:hypothetical protein